ncbi:MAG: NifB/NifX family molybdenum-iron cluster-binding protein [Candidatus Auribacterota bacterium]|jgi:predicted Fe-Mo cluster-binding NifX family protein|nr:NifB/NifX family molybdenum-iron cluster-binding protein [Candidatus Auribacterota bacterium]
MRIAIPLVQDKLSMHFGHCEKFLITEIDKETKQILNIEKLTPPSHEPGVLPKWLHELNVDVIIAGGMGTRAQSLFNQHGIDVTVGACKTDPDEIIKDYLNDALIVGNNSCDH